MVAHLFGKANDSRRAQASVALIVIALTVGYGSYVGATYRSARPRKPTCTSGIEGSGALQGTVETLVKLCEKNVSDACNVLLQPTNSATTASTK